MSERSLPVPQRALMIIQMRGMFWGSFAGSGFRPSLKAFQGLSCVGVGGGLCAVGRAVSRHVTDPDPPNAEVGYCLF